MIRPLLNLLVLLSVVFVIAIVGAKTLGIVQPPSPLLAFMSDRDREDGYHDLFVVDVAHNIATNITRSLTGLAPGYHVWNRSGDLAFAFYDGVQDSEIYVWRNNGELINVSQNERTFNTLPAWSADGRLAFTSVSDAGITIEIWDNGVINDIEVNAHQNAPPAWSSDGRLAFVSISDSSSNINVWDGQTITTAVFTLFADQLSWNEAGQLTYLAVVDSDLGVYVWDGTENVSIVQTDSADLVSAWSPSGQLAFNVNSINGRELYLWQEGTPVNISPQGGDAYLYPSGWSSDERLAFVSNAMGYFDVYVWDGTSATNISNNSAYDGNPVWADNGWLAFESNRDGNSEIYVWDGTTVRNFSHNFANDTAPAWWFPSS